MTNRIQLFLRRGLLVTSAAMLSTLAVGCGDDAPPPPDKSKRKVVAQPKGPSTTPVADLMTQNDIDDRIWMEDRLAPTTDQRRVLVLKFFNGFFSGDADAIRPFLSDVEVLGEGREGIVVLEPENQTQGIQVGEHSDDQKEQSKH